jgi:chemotaxis regulatin CheY-phosphate phosphatase CheZ
MDKKKAKKEIARALAASLKDLGIDEAGKKVSKIIDRAASKLAVRLAAGQAKKKKKKAVKKAKPVAKKKKATARKRVKRAVDAGFPAEP